MKKFLIALIVAALVTGFVLADDFVGLKIDRSSETLVMEAPINSTKSSQAESYEKLGAVVTVDRRFLSDFKADLMMDRETELLGFFCGEDFFVISKEQSLALLSEPFFDQDFQHRILPAVGFSVNGYARLLVPSSSEWTMKLPDGTERTLAESSDSMGRWTLPQGSAVHMEFTLMPTRLQIESEDGEVWDVEGKSFTFPEIESWKEYRLIASWDDEKYHGQIVYPLQVAIDLPMQTTILQSTPVPGSLVTLEIRNAMLDGIVEVSHPFGPSVTAHDRAEYQWALIPIDYWTEPGAYELTLLSSASHENLVVPLTVESRQFDTQYLYIDKEVEKTTRSDEAYEEFALYMNPARESSADEPYFDSGFIQPVEGRISTEFGMYRYVNDSLTSYRHSGIDIAIQKGTPIEATNRGVVTLAQSLILTGNTVVIDHGAGIFSVYFHLDTLETEAGQMVEQGQVIGTVGSTGFSTGPHLHWTMSFYKTNIDPYQFTKGSILPDLIE